MALRRFTLFVERVSVVEGALRVVGEVGSGALCLGDRFLEVRREGADPLPVDLVVTAIGLKPSGRRGRTSRLPVRRRPARAA